MKIVIQKTRRRKSESGFELNETPQVITLTGEFAETEIVDSDCSGRKVGSRFKKIHLCNIPFGKYYSECQVKNNPCIPANALTYKPRVSE